MRRVNRLLLIIALVVPALAGCSRNPTPVQATSVGPKTVHPRTSIDSGIEGGTTAVAVSNDGKVVITQVYGKTKNVQIWDIQKEQKLHEFANESGSVLPVAIAPDGKTAAYTTSFIDPPRVSLRDVATGLELHQLSPKDRDLGFPTGLKFSPGGDLLIVAGGKDIVGWHPATGEQRITWEADNKDVTALSNFFDGGKKIASGGAEGTIKVWEVASAKCLQTLSVGPKEKIVSLAVSPDGKTLVSATLFIPIQVWDLSSGKLRRTIASSGTWASVLLPPDGQTILYTGRDYNLILEDVETGTQRHELQGHTKNVWSLSLTADGATHSSLAAMTRQSKCGI
ncbi:MAG: hypothetical protein L0215_01505 [Gemmataceae bacterium]|nr:hypothetical protein [Gemmataceae bacterium]